MPMVPLIWIAGALTFFAGAAVLQSDSIPAFSRGFFGCFLAALTAILGILGLRLGYGVHWANLAQPVLALTLAPSAYLGFLSLTNDEALVWRRTALRHVLPVVLAQTMIVVGTPISPDVLVLCVTGVYLVLLAQFVPIRPDAMVQVPAKLLPIARVALYATLLFLTATVATDLTLVVVTLFAGEASVLRFLSGAAGILTIFVLVAALIGVSVLSRVGRVTNAAVRKPARPTHDDQALLDALDQMLTTHQLHRDSSLTLARVARRMGVPARDVSAAVNRCTGDNFSRHINKLRIDHARRALTGSALPVTEIMLESGFVSKSVFNAEFRRMTGKTPTQYRADGGRD